MNRYRHGTHRQSRRRFVGTLALASATMMVLAILMRLHSAERLPSPIPLAEGTSWTYEANVKWTPVAGDGPPGVRTNRFEWTASVVKCFAGQNRRAAVVHAWPDELAGMGPVQPVNYVVLLEAPTRLYRFLADDRLQAERLARNLVDGKESLESQREVYFELPLSVGKRWGNIADDPQREDGWYCWRVEAQHHQPMRVKGAPSIQAAVVYTVAFRTLPDHQVVTIAPGIGILSFQYEHHGTVGSSDVRLIEFKEPRTQ